MKPLLFLLLLSVFLSCFAQENERNVIVKNKVKSVTIKANKSDSVGYYTEYNSKGLIIKTIERRTHYAPLIKKTSYNFDYTLLKTKIVTVNKEDTLVFTDTTYYEYDNKGRLINEFDPEIKENSGCYMYHSGRVILYSYLDSFTKKVYKKKYFDSDEEWYKNNCRLIYKDNKNYYLNYYEIIKYIPTQTEPIIYRFDEFRTHDNKKTGMFYNTTIENEKGRIWDTLFRYESHYTKFDSGFLQKGLLCDENEVTGIGKFFEKSELKTYRNSKIVKNVTEDAGIEKHVSIESFIYYDNGLINKVFSCYRYGVSSQYAQPLLNESNITYVYHYEYFK